MPEIRETSVSFVPDRGFLNECRGVGFHYAHYDALPWMIGEAEGILSLSKAKRDGKPIKSEHIVSVQDANDRPEWISVLDADSKSMPWKEVLPLGHFSVIASKSRLEIKEGEAQHRLPGEAWVEDWINSEAIEGFLVSGRVLDMKIGEFFEAEIGDDRYKQAYARYSSQARSGDKALNVRILEVVKRTTNEVNEEMAGAFWLLIGEEAERRRNKAVVVAEWVRRFDLDPKTQTVADWLKKMGREQHKKIWRLEYRQDPDGLTSRPYIEKINF